MMFFSDGLCNIDIFYLIGWEKVDKLFFNFFVHCHCHLLFPPQGLCRGIDEDLVVGMLFSLKCLYLVNFDTGIWCSTVQIHPSLNSKHRSMPLSSLLHQL